MGASTRVTSECTSKARGGSVIKGADIHQGGDEKAN